MRAYKLAEELGLTREDLIKKAAEIGIEIRNPMATIDDDQAGTIRRKFAAGSETETVQKRVGSGVIRRRKRKTESEADEAPGSGAEMEAGSIEPEAIAASDAVSPEATPEVELPGAVPPGRAVKPTSARRSHVRSMWGTRPHHSWMTRMPGPEPDFGTAR